VATAFASPEEAVAASAWTLEAPVEAGPQADNGFRLIEADVPMAETPTAGTPAIARAETASTSPAWSWMESEASTPLADILAAVAKTSKRIEPAAEESVVEKPVAHPVAIPEAPAAEVIAAPAVPEVFNPDAAASWNAATAFGAAPAEEDEPVTIEEVAASPAPTVVSGSPVVNDAFEVHDPVRAAAWRMAMAGHVADVPGPTALVMPATVAVDPEPDTSPAVDEWGGQMGPVLGEEFLALIGNAARQASLDAFDALDQTSTSEPPSDQRERPRVRSAARGNRPAPSRKERRKKPRPAQDEWGMFDPAQAGADALFDEDAWDDEPDGRRPSPRGRSAA
jgi:hypothetical protein